MSLLWLFNQHHPVAPVGGVVFRKTLAQFGTRVGDRQQQVPVGSGSEALAARGNEEDVE